MIKTIKVKKQMRLDELIKYVWDNGITNRKFQGNYFKHVEINEVGEVRLFMQETPIFSFDKHNTFTVEIEEPITKNTVFDNLIEVTKNDNALHYYRTNISDVATNRSSKRFYALIDGKLQLVWERDEECVMSIRN